MQVLITGKHGGIFGNGMHQFLLDDMELGERVALALDSENSDPLMHFLDLSIRMGELSID
jgi:hypothetical protein